MTATMLHSVAYRSVLTLCKELINKYQQQFNPRLFVEIGASIGGNARSIFPDAEYYNLDIKASEHIPTIVTDITKECAISGVDLIYSSDCFEHLKKPWLAADNLSSMLHIGGFIFISTVFSWRYHPVPEDYYRFTPAGLMALFEDKITCLETNFNSYFRRHNIVGRWSNKKDAVPVDDFGGFRENWRVYYFGQRSC